MTWKFITETLFAKYQLHNTAVGLAFFVVLCIIYVKYSISTNDNNHKFNYIGEKLGVLEKSNEKILEKVNEHDLKFNNVDMELKMTKTHLENKWEEFTRGKSSIPQEKIYAETQTQAQTSAQEERWHRASKA